MEPDIKRILEDIKTLKDSQLEEISATYVGLVEEYSNGKDRKKEEEVKIIYNALREEKWHRQAIALYKKVPETYEELMTEILSGDIIEGLSKEDLKG